MRILLVSNCSLNPNQGSGYVICGYMQKLVDRGHQVEAFGPEHFILFPKAYRLKRFRLLLGYTLATIRQIRHNRYDLIELWGGPGWLSVLFVKFLYGDRIKIVSRSNGLESHFYETLYSRDLSKNFCDSIKWRLDASEFAFRYSDGLTVVSEYDRAYALAKAYQPLNRLLAINNPLEPSWLNQAVDFKRAPVIGFVGSWLENKGSDILPEIVRYILENHSTAEFYFIGVGDKGMEDLRDFTSTNRVRIIPFCSRSDILPLYHKMAILIMPSIFESYGLVAAEAMSCGVVLAATPVGIAAGLNDSQYLYLAKRSPKFIGDHIVTMLNDEACRFKKAKAGYAYVQSLGWDSAVDRLEKFYESII